MIPKVSSGSNYFGLFSYLEDKKKQVITSEDGINVIEGSERIAIFNFYGQNGIDINSDKAALNTEFIEWDSENKNKRFEKKVAHFSISFAPHDTVDKEKTILIANEFLEKLGYKDNPTIIYQHNDKHHNHIHIVTSRVGFKGKKIVHDKEAIRAIAICRELEIKYGLTRVVKNDSKENLTNKPSSQKVKASSSIPFRNAIIQNLQFFLHTEKVIDLTTLKKRLLGEGIEMVTHDKDGIRLPKNGVRFYYKEDNKIISYLSGKDIEKNFFNNIEKRFALNVAGALAKEDSVLKVVDKETVTFIPTLKPNFSINKKIGHILSDALQTCVNSVIVTSNDLIKLLEVHKITPEFKTDKKGALTGLSFIHEGVRYKGSDFVVNGVKLSAQLLAPHFIEKLNGAKVVRFAIDSIQEYNKAIGGEGVSKQVLIEVLNRNNIRIVEIEGKGELVINQLGKVSSIDLSKYPNGGYLGFLKDAGFNGINDLAIEHKVKLEKPYLLVSALSLQEKVVYSALLKGNVKDIQEISKLQVKIALTNNESKKLSKPVKLLYHYNDMHNKMGRAADYLKYLGKKNTVTPSVYETIKALNLRGIAIMPTYKSVDETLTGQKREVKSIDFMPIADKSGNPPLNFYQTIAALSSTNLKEIFNNPDPQDQRLLDTVNVEKGNFFKYDTEVTELILAGESEPSLIHEYKDELLSNYPELATEVEYIESLEDTKGLYVQPERETHYLSTFFKDFGTLYNKGFEGKSFKNMRSKSGKIRK